jgi:hypothetical protein
MGRWTWCAVLALAALLPTSGRAVAGDPTAFSLLTEAKGLQPETGLNGVVRLQLDGTDAVDMSKLQLSLGDSALGVAPEWRSDGRVAVFSLQRTKENRALWVKLLGAPFDHERILPVAIHLDYAGKPLAFRYDPDASGDFLQAPLPRIGLVTYNSGCMALGLIAAVIVAAIILMGCWKTTMMRDGPIPQMLKEDRPYSLGRFQMAVWFCLVFASFIFILVTTSDFGSITAQTFVLLGISGATALGSIAIEQSKDSPSGKAEQALSDMGLKTREDVEALQKIPDADRTGQQKQLWAVYEATIKDFRTGGILNDLVTDVNGPTIHRWQILIWTLTLGVIYLWWTYAHLETPTFDNNLLVLMGISGGIYLGFKIPERQSSPT